MAVTAETIYKRFLTSICVDRELQKWENLELTVMVFSMSQLITHGVSWMMARSVYPPLVVLVDRLN
jgi:hypothetical protein